MWRGVALWHGGALSGVCGMECKGTEWCVAWSLVVWSGSEWSGTVWSGVAKRSSIEKSRMEMSGVALCSME